ncbi:hypothetical protein [Pseudomonas sp. BF-R-21]|uniref:hypothetical protein n=1 Tax=Pseudomonas sp. BF-R-21 TaxID=2832387 RepID=UPI001CBFE9F0|nr:hypothetical protein [Pseudomonas sp. BF-R-21]
MQHCSCFVFLGGELTSSVWKADVTVAEIALLRAIHGDDAITTIVPTYKANTKSADELDRLRQLYGQSNVSKEGKRLVDEVYPGRAPQLPTSLSDIGVDVLEEQPTAPVEAPKAAKASKQNASDALLGSGE